MFRVEGEVVGGSHPLRIKLPSQPVAVKDDVPRRMGGFTAESIPEGLSSIAHSVSYPERLRDAGGMSGNPCLSDGRT
jgi:hypothetical protein